MGRPPLSRAGTGSLQHSSQSGEARLGSESRGLGVEQFSPLRFWR